MHHYSCKKVIPTILPKFATYCYRVSLWTSVNSQGTHLARNVYNSMCLNIILLPLGVTILSQLHVYQPKSGCLWLPISRSLRNMRLCCEENTENCAPTFTRKADWLPTISTAMDSVISVYHFQTLLNICHSLVLTSPEHYNSMLLLTNIKCRSHLEGVL